MQITFTTSLDHLSPQQLGQVHGEAFAEMAIQLRRRGLQPEVWGEFMKNRMASLSRQFDTQEQVDAWAQACVEAFDKAVDQALAEPPNILTVLEPEGRA